MLQSKSIAVLPLSNISQDEESEYFSDGMTDEIINALGKISGLKVIARTSSFAYKNKAIDVRLVGNELGVDTILEGSVRKYKTRVRILVALVRTDNGAQLWSESFDRDLEDIFALQDEVSLLIADKIRENYGHLEIQNQLVKAPTQNLEVYNNYLKARYHHLKWDGQGIRMAVELYEQCVVEEPEFSLPYFGLGYSYAMYGSWGVNKAMLERSAYYLNKGFELDQESYLGYFAKATLCFWGNWDFIQGHQFFKKALELNPSYTEAEEGLIELYTATGFFEEALKHTEHILTINPLSPNHYFTQANIYYLSKDFSKAVSCLESSLKIDPKFSHSIALLQLCYIHLAEYQKLEEFIETNPLAESPEECLALYQLVHQSDKININIDHLSSQIKEEQPVTLFPWQLFIKVYLGNHDLALDFLEEAVQKRTGQIINFQNIPLLEPLHQYQRFQDLVSVTFAQDNLPALALTIPKNS